MHLLKKLGLVQVTLYVMVLPTYAREQVIQANLNNSRTKIESHTCTNSAIDDLKMIEKQLSTKSPSAQTTLDQDLLANRPYARQVIGELHANIKDSKAWFGLGCFCSSARKSQEAELAYKNALALNPNYAMALNNLGTELMNQNRLKEAEAAYIKSLRIDPSGSWTNLAEVRHQMGDTKGEQAAHEHARASGEEATMQSYLRFYETLKQQHH